MLLGVFNGLQDLIYPRICLACKKKSSLASKQDFICPACSNKIEKNLPPFCASCGRHLEKNDLGGNICLVCKNTKLHFDRAFNACNYTGIIKELIHQFKYNNKDYLGKPLADIMKNFIHEYSLPMEYLDLIIPVPLHKIRLRSREFNQAQILSEYIGAAFNKKVMPNTLIRKKQTQAQAGLKTKERFLNVAGSFLVKNPETIVNKNILLVDDVLTTGATSSEAALALKDAGANVVFVMTLAS